MLNKNEAIITTGYIFILLLAFLTSCELMPRNTLKDCEKQCPDTKNPTACYDFCDCIHHQGRPLDSCLEAYEKAEKEIKK